MILDPALAAVQLFDSKFILRSKFLKLFLDVFDYQRVHLLRRLRRDEAVRIEIRMES